MAASRPRLALALVAFFASGLFAGCSGRGSGPSSRGKQPTFVEHVVDADNSGDCKAVGDLDGDGRPDLVVAGRQLVWYHNPDWHKTVIADAQDQFTTDCQVADIDRDGRPDIVVPDGSGTDNVVWFRNPGPGGAPWARNPIGSHGGYAHDLEVGDLMGNGKIDVVTRKPGITSVFIQGATPDTWTRTQISSRDGEGTAIGNVAGHTDGRLDIVTGGFWFENTSSGWVEHEITGKDNASVTVADMNHDGRADVVIGPLEVGDRGEVAWYEGGDPGQKHLITPDTGRGCDYHTLKTADMNGDGNRDVVTACMFGKVSVWINENRRGTRWREVVVSRHAGIHNLRVADVEHDGDVDIFGSNYIGHPPVRVWINKLRR
jgi:hypothetical protein